LRLPPPAPRPRACCAWIFSVLEFPLACGKSRLFWLAEFSAAPPPAPSGFPAWIFWRLKKKFPSPARVRFSLRRARRGRPRCAWLCARPSAFPGVFSPSGSAARSPRCPPILGFSLGRERSPRAGGPAFFRFLALRLGFEIWGLCLGVSGPRLPGLGFGFFLFEPWCLEF
jgi:hypothetical protein